MEERFPNPGVAGVLLAGGRSKRFGEDKRFFKLGEKTLLEIACEKLSRFRKKYVIFEPGFSPDIQRFPALRDFQVLHDVIPYGGPLMAIYYALSCIGEKAGVFIPVDMPLLPEKMLFFLADIPSDIAYMSFRDDVYPLPALYSKSVLPHLGKMIRKGVLSLRKLIDEYPSERKCEIRFEDIAKKLGISPESMTNINRKEDILNLKGKF